MKNLVVVSLLLAGSTFAQAETRLSSDGSVLSGICIAATNSSSAMIAAARAADISPLDLNSVRCNGLTLSRFAAKYRKVEEKEEKGYVFKQSDASELSALCIAAVKSDQEYDRLKQAHFSDVQNLETEVLCNGMPLKSFARKYRAPALTISLR